MARTVTSEAATRMTLYIPAELLAEADRLTGRGEAKSRNDFVVMAIRHLVRELNRAATDAAFAAAAVDADYQAEDAGITTEFSKLDTEAERIEAMEE